MTGSIYLIGGGEIRDGDTQTIDHELRSLAVEGSIFVFFGTAAQDSVEYSDAIKSVFDNKFKVLISTEEKGREFAINAIKSSSVIYLGGGDTDRLMRLFSEWKLVEYLSAALERGVHIVGMSAGAQALSNWYIHEEGDDLEIRKGWEIAPVCTLVHANQVSFEKAKSLWANFYKGDECPFVAIGENAAWRISASGEQGIGSGDIWRMNDSYLKEVA